MSTKEKILTGQVCRFCKKEFIDKTGNPMSYKKPAVCKDCNLLSAGHISGYIQGNDTKPDESVWALRKSEILEEIQSEVESDFAALALQSKIRREEKKELFEERWLPKFKEWLGDDIFWDEKKYCYTLNLEKDDQPATIDFYPKANKALYRNLNKWYKNGVKWLTKEVLPNEYCH